MNFALLPLLLEPGSGVSKKFILLLFVHLDPQQLQRVQVVANHVLQRQRSQSPR